MESNRSPLRLDGSSTNLDEGLDVWCFLLLHHVAPFVSDRIDWNNLMAVCKAMYAAAQKQQTLPPFPSLITTPNFAPTVLCFSPDGEWMIMGDKEGEIRALHVRHGWTGNISHSSDLGTTHDPEIQRLFDEVQQAGPVRQLTFIPQSWNDNSKFQLVLGQGFKVTLWRLTLSPEAGTRDEDEMEKNPLGVWLPYQELEYDDGELVRRGPEIMTLSAHPSAPAIFTGHLVTDLPPPLVPDEERSQNIRGLVMSWHVLDRKDNETFHCTLGKVIYDVSPSFVDHGNSLAYIRSRSGLYTHCLPSRETEAPELDLLDGVDHSGRWVIHAPPESSGVLSSCVGYGCDGQLQGVAALTLAPRQLVVGWGEAGDVFPWPPRHVHLEKENVEDVNRANRIFDELFRPFSPHGVVREARFQFPDGIPRHLCLCLGPNASNFAMGYCKVGDRSGVVRVRSFDPSDEEDYRLNLGRRADTGLSIDNILANVLIRHVGPFIDDTHDWLNFMAVTPVMYQQSQVMATDPPLPRCIRTESFIPTALLFTPDDKSILVGTSTGEIRVFHRRRGFLPTSFGTSDLAQLVRSSGPILGLDIVHSSGDMRLAVAQKKRITLWVRDVEEGSWTPQVDLSYVLDDVESLENADRFSGDILHLGCAESSSQSMVQTCHLVKDESGNSSIQIQYKFLRNQAYERSFFALPGDPIQFPSLHAREGDSRSCTVLPPVHAHNYGEPGSEDALDQWVLLVPPLEQDVISICSNITADGRTVVATANSEGVVKELSGNPIHKMVALPRGFNSMWEYMEWLGYDDYEVTIGTISPAVAPCLKYSFDGSMLGAGYDLGDGNGQIELWTIGERGKEDDGSDSDYDDDESFDY